MIFLFSLLAIFIMAAILATPLTFFAMLFLGNIGIHWGFLQILPGAIALRIATTSISTKESR